MSDCGNCYDVGVPIVIEIVINDGGKAKEVEGRLLDCLFNNKDIIPGLGINKIYKQSITAGSIQSAEMRKEFDVLSESFKRFLDKWEQEPK